MSCCGSQINPLTLMLAAKIGAKAVQCGDRIIVWWLGIRWYGIPWPARLVLALAVYERRILEDDQAAFPDLCQPGGCGCIVALKDLAERWTPRLAKWLDRCSARSEFDPNRFDHAAARVHRDRLNVRPEQDDSAGSNKPHPTLAGLL